MSLSSREERLVTFLVAGAAYAIPIADVLEVTEVGRPFAVPSLPRSVAGVVNHHGDALPVVAPSVLFEVAAEDMPEPQHLLVLAGSDAEVTPSVGLPVDRICGLVPGSGGTAREGTGIVERRPIDGRVVSILDTKRLLARAATSIEQAAVGDAGGEQGG
jgi:chemotaxis signal transduction protein